MGTNRMIMVPVVLLLVASAMSSTDSCGPEILTTPAVYFEAVGVASDKPIFPTILATQNPTDAEVQCCLKTPLRSSTTVFVIPKDELESATRIVKVTAVAAGKPKPQQERFRYVLVGRSGVETGLLDRNVSAKIFGGLRTYFERRDAKVSEHFGVLAKRLGL